MQSRSSCSPTMSRCSRAPTSTSRATWRRASPSNSSPTAKIHGFVNKLLYPRLRGWREVMRSSQSLRREVPAGIEADLAHYWREGYAIVRGFFGRDDVAEIAAAADRLYAEGLEHGRSFRHANLFYNVAHRDAEIFVRMVQWPSYHQPVLDAVRLDLRFAE